jgi:hypothetical protein
MFYRLADLPVDIAEDDPTITYRGVDYRALERKQDGDGGVTVQLQER